MLHAAAKAGIDDIDDIDDSDTLAPDESQKRWAGRSRRRSA